MVSTTHGRCEQWARGRTDGDTCFQKGLCVSRIRSGQKSVPSLKCSLSNSPFLLFSPLHKDLVCILELATVIFFFQNKADRCSAQVSAWHGCNWKKCFVKYCPGISVNPWLRKALLGSCPCFKVPHPRPGSTTPWLLLVENVVSHSFEN